MKKIAVTCFMLIVALSIYARNWFEPITKAEIGYCHSLFNSKSTSEIWLGIYDFELAFYGKIAI